MPYIKPDDRYKLDIKSNPVTSGELNYCLTRQINDYLNEKDLSYHTINDILGALEGCKLEFYRRIAIPYEDSKLTENGDVYDLKKYNP